MKRQRDQWCSPPAKGKHTFLVFQKRPKARFPEPLAHQTCPGSWENHGPTWTSWSSAEVVVSKSYTVLETSIKSGLLQHQSCPTPLSPAWRRRQSTLGREDNWLMCLRARLPSNWEERIPVVTQWGGKHTAGKGWGHLAGSKLSVHQQHPGMQEHHNQQMEAHTWTLGKVRSQSWGQGGLSYLQPGR